MTFSQFTYLLWLAPQQHLLPSWASPWVSVTLNCMELSEHVCCFQHRAFFLPALSPETPPPLSTQEPPTLLGGTGLVSSVKPVPAQESLVFLEHLA